MYGGGRGEGVCVERDFGGGWGRRTGPSFMGFLLQALHASLLCIYTYMYIHASVNACSLYICTAFLPECLTLYCLLLFIHSHTHSLSLHPSLLLSPSFSLPPSLLPPPAQVTVPCVRSRPGQAVAARVHSVRLSARYPRQPAG